MRLAPLGLAALISVGISIPAFAQDEPKKDEPAKQDLSLIHI